MAPWRLEPATLPSTFWQATLLGFDFPAFLGALVYWLFGTIILSPDLRSGCHYVARFDPDLDLGLFRPKQHSPHC